jgi:AcrR family transcriptional regulator
MIADRLGVTKAAVYHQFHTKDDIVMAVVQPALEQIASLLERAEPHADPSRRRDLALEGLVDLVLDQRRVMAALHGDPGIAEVMHAHPDLVSKIDRLQVLLLGPDPGVGQLIAAAMVGGGLMGVGVSPQLAGTDRDTLRRELLDAARRLLGVTT